MTTLHQEGNVVYLFGPPPEETPPPKLEVQLTLDGYLSHLLKKGTLSSFEHSVLSEALDPLKEQFQYMTTVASVRKELGPTQNKKIRDLEKALWEGTNLIPGFNPQSRLDIFQVLSQNDPDHSVTGINSEMSERIKSQSHLPQRLDRGIIFFWIVVRMCRLQDEMDQAELAKSRPERSVPTESPSHRPASSQRKVITKKIEMPTLREEPKEHLIEQPPLRQRGWLERGVEAVFNLFEWKNRWRRIAIETRN